MIYSLARHSLALLFLAAATLKFIDLPVFKLGIESFQIFPSHLIPYLVFITPTLELFCALSLYHPKLQRPASLLLFLLCVSFSSLYAYSIFKGSHPNCGCFGSYLQASPIQGLIRALIFSTLSIASYCESLFTTQSPSSHTTS